MQRELSRRRFVVTAGAATITGLAGCGDQEEGQDVDDEEEENPGEAEGGAEEAEGASEEEDEEEEAAISI